ncbi:hypothetical protein CLOP_g12477 [Closterium sp. NIES-67]|nr:hypothetical protein CLOP_g12477 [Closterium sp. NIES-67]
MASLQAESPGEGASQPLSPVADPPPVLQFAPSSQTWTTEEDAVLLRHALKHGTRQWGRLVRGKQLARGNKACCNRFIFLKKKFAQKHAIVASPAQQQQFKQGASIVLSASQPERHTWSRPDVALQYGGLSLDECMRLFLPPALRGVVVSSDVSPDVSPDSAPAPVPAADATAAADHPAEADSAEREQVVAVGAARVAAAAVRSNTAAAADQLAHLLSMDAQAVRVRTTGPSHSYPMDRGVKRHREADMATSAGRTAILSANQLQGLRGVQGLPGVQGIQVQGVQGVQGLQGLHRLDSSVVELLLGRADSQRRQLQAEGRPTLPSSLLLALLLQQKQQQQQQLPSLLSQGTLGAESMRSMQSAQPIQSLHGAPLSAAAHCSSINALSSAAVPALDWPPTFSPSFSPLKALETFKSLEQPLKSAAVSRPSTSLPLLSRRRGAPLSSLESSTWRSAAHMNVAFGSVSSSPSGHSTHLNSPHYPLTPPPSSHLHATAPITPTSPPAPAPPLAPVTPSALNPGLPLPSFPSLSALQSALHTAPHNVPPAVPDHSHQYPSRTASPSNAASSASVSGSPHSSQLSPKRNIAPVEVQQPQAAAAPPAAAAQPVAAAECAQKATLLCAGDAPPLDSSTLADMRPHKTARTSRGVLPPAALEFARSFFSHLPGSGDPEGGKSSEGRESLDHTRTSARQGSLAGNADTEYGSQFGAGAMEMPQVALQPSVLATAAASTASPAVSASPAAAAVAAAAEGTCHGELSIWKDLIELEVGTEGGLCCEEKIKALTVGSFCELENLFCEEEPSNVAPYGMV